MRRQSFQKSKLDQLWDVIAVAGAMTGRNPRNKKITRVFSAFFERQMPFPFWARFQCRRGNKACRDKDGKKRAVFFEEPKFIRGRKFTNAQRAFLATLSWVPSRAFCRQGRRF